MDRRAVLAVLAVGLTLAAGCVRPAPSPATLHDPAVSWPVTGGDPAIAVDATVLEREPATIRLRVPTGWRDARLERIVRRGAGDLTWYGRTGDTAGTDVVVTAVGGAVAATVETAEGTVVVDPAGPGRGRLRRVTGALSRGTERVARPPVAAAPPALPAAPVETVGALEEPPGYATVDVMIVHGSAMTALHRAPGVAAVAQNAVDRANIAFYASRIAVQVRLVGIVNLSDHEADLADLEALRASGVVRWWREALGADLVQAWGAYPGLCGQGYQNLGAPAPDWAFSVVSAGCVLGVAPIHEWGHNLGAGHDHLTDDPDHAGDRAFPDAYGYVSPSGFATIMAYDDANCPAAGCRRVHLFSNPDVGWGGSPTGVPGYADNARAIHALGPVVANYRPSRR